MTRIYLIRHAEAEGNLYRIAQGQANSNLTDRGWRQVRALERRFAGVPIDAVYASDLYRTCATSSAIYKAKGLPLHRTRALREICVGVWEQRSWGEIYRRWPEEMDHFSHRPDLWQLEGAEDARAAGPGCWRSWGPSRTVIPARRWRPFPTAMCCGWCCPISRAFPWSAWGDPHRGQHRRLTAGGGGRPDAGGLPG